MSEHCLRCGVHITAIPETGDPLDERCTPPAALGPYPRHLFSEKSRRRREKRDQQKLQRWIEAQK